jgi:hypothetical protein
MDPSGRKDDIQINPWTLINMSKEKEMTAAEYACERIRQAANITDETTVGEKTHHKWERYVLPEYLILCLNTKICIAFCLLDLHYEIFRSVSTGNIKDGILGGYFEQSCK